MCEAPGHGLGNNDLGREWEEEKSEREAGADLQSLYATVRSLNFGKHAERSHRGL